MKLYSMNQRGQGAVEYALLVISIIIVIAAMSTGPLKSAINTAFSKVQTKINNVAT